MLVDLPNHLGPHVTSGVADVGIEIGENIFALGIREEDIARGVGEGKCVEGILDGLETMEDMQECSFQILASSLFSRTREEKRSHCARGVGGSHKGAGTVEPEAQQRLSSMDLEVKEKEEGEAQRLPC